MKSFLFRTILKRALCVAMAFVCLVSFAGCGKDKGLIAEGVSVSSVNIGGMTKAEARTLLKAETQKRLLAQDLVIQLPEETITLSSEQAVKKADIRSAVRDAYRYGRTDAPGSGKIGFLGYITINEEAIRQALTTYAETYDTSFSESVWVLEGTAPDLSTDSCDPAAPVQNLKVTLGIPELHLDVNAVYEEILDVYSKAVDPAESGAFLVTPEVLPEKVPQAPELETLWAEFCVETTDDSLDMTSYEFVPGSYGYQFDKEVFIQKLSQTGYGGSFSLPMEIVSPEILGQQVYYRDVLGEYQTKHNENENRNTNLRLLCQSLNGHILQPGEEFSFNGVVGERTKERGYKPAPAYSGNRLVDDYGGGVCQGSTTLYNCVLLADLEVVFRACHGATVGYVPLGLDATVNYLTTDFKFRNNFHFPIQLQAEVSDGYVKMKILGSDEKDYYIKMESRYGEDDIAVYARSYKCRYSKQTGELLSRDLEAYSTYYKDIG